MSTRHRVLVVLALLAGIAASSCDNGDPAAPAAPTTLALEATTSTSISPPVSAADGEVFTIRPWFLTDAGLVQGEPRFVQGPDVLASTLDQLLSGPTDTDRFFGLGTGISPRVRVRSAVLDGDTVTVDLDRSFETADTQPQVAQVVWTLTELQGVQKVKFLIDGEDNGATGVRPMGRADTRVQPAG
ncbi:MAG: GerMN domain-containing protein [Acidimicrobiales bacterium]